MPTSEPHEQEEVRALIALLERDPANLEALTGLGSLLHGAGLYESARTAFAEAVRTHPADAAAQTNLANAYLDARWMNLARTHYERALRLDPLSVHAHRGLALLLLRAGDPQGAREHGRIGFRKIVTQPFRGEGTPLPILILTSGLAGNMNTTARFWDNRLFAKSVVVTEFWEPEDELPEHGLIFNAIADADLCAEALRNAQRLIATSPAPAVNDPAAVLATGRLENARRLGMLDGVVTAATAAFPRALLERPQLSLEAHGFTFPLLIRSPGYQTGQHFVRAERPADLERALTSLPGEELLVMNFLDVRSPDGMVRKYRAMIVDGRLYPLHLAISEHWMVHYFTAAMDREDHRREEAAFLADMPGTLGAAAMRALERVARRLGLDYAGVDFSLDREGRLVLFEANATMVVRRPEPGEAFAYRNAPVERILDAVHAMLFERAGWTSRAAGPIPKA